jgi:hypothetical protein
VTFGFPYSVQNATKNIIRQLQIALHYTDDGGFWVPGSAMQVSFLETRASLNMDVATNPNIAGNVVAFPWACKVSKIGVPLQLVGAFGDFDLFVTEMDGTVLDFLPYEGNHYSVVNANRTAELLLPYEVEFPANTPRRIVIAPTSGNNITLPYDTQIAALFPYFAGGQIYMCASGAGFGAFTDYNNGTDGYRWLEMFFGISAIDIPSGGGGQAVSIFG